MNPENETKQVQELFDHLNIAWNSGSGGIVLNEVENIRFLSHNVALVSYTTTRFSWQNDAPAKDELVNNSVVIKEEGAWKVAAIL